MPESAIIDQRPDWSTLTTRRYFMESSPVPDMTATQAAIDGMDRGAW